MKFKLGLVVAASCVLLAVKGISQEVKKFAVNGSLSHVEADKIYMVYLSNNEVVIDSAMVADNKYSFKGSMSSEVFPAAIVPAPYSQDVTGLLDGRYPEQMLRYRGWQFFLLEPGTISLAHKDSITNARIKGGKANSDYEKLGKELQVFFDRAVAAYNVSKSYSADDSIAIDKSFAVINAIEVERNKKALLGFLEKNPQSPIAAYVLQNYMNSKASLTDLEPVYKQLPDEVKKTRAGIAVAKKIEAESKTRIGAIAMDFTQSDTAGKAISLSSFRGKYVLLDFWASWCAPCRKENPNIVAAYHKYNGRGFEILSVSLDVPNGEKAWLKAIHDDGLTWAHVSDLKWWNNEVALLYDIEAVPANFLIDPSGKIVAKNLRGEELEKVLADIFH